MTGDDYKPKRVFTLEEANAALPLVRAITRDLVERSQEIIERRQRLELLRGSRDLATDDPYSEELAQIEADLEKDSEQLQEYVNELHALGVELKNPVEGILDFPARMDDRYIYLCWKYGEPEVLHWHELETGFAGRQPLTAGSVAEDGSNSEEPTSIG